MGEFLTLGNHGINLGSKSISRKDEVYMYRAVVSGYLKVQHTRKAESAEARRPAKQSHKVAGRRPIAYPYPERT